MVRRSKLILGLLIVVLFAGSCSANIWSLTDYGNPDLLVEVELDNPSQVCKVSVENTTLATYEMGLNLMDFSSGIAETVWVIDNTNPTWHSQEIDALTPVFHTSENTTYGVHLRNKYVLTYYDIGLNVLLSDYDETTVAHVYFDITPKANRQDIVLYHSLGGYVTGTGNMNRYSIPNGWMMEWTSGGVPTSDAWMGVILSSGVGVIDDFPTEPTPQGVYYSAKSGITDVGDTFYEPFYTITVDKKQTKLQDELALLTEKGTIEMEVQVDGVAKDYGLTDTPMTFTTRMVENTTVPIQSEFILLDTDQTTVLYQEEMMHFGDMNTSKQVVNYTFSDVGTYYISYAWLDFTGNIYSKQYTLVVNDVPPYEEQLEAFSGLEGIIIGLLAGVIPLLMVGWWGTQPIMALFSFLRTRDTEDWNRLTESARNEYMYENFGGYLRTSGLTVAFLFVIGYMFIQLGSIFNSVWVAALIGLLGIITFFVIRGQMFQRATYTIDVGMTVQDGTVLELTLTPREGDNIPKDVIKRIDDYVQKKITYAMPVDEVVAKLGKSYDVKSLKLQGNKLIMKATGDYKPNYFLPVVFIITAGIAVIITWAYGAAFGVASPGFTSYLVDVGGAAGGILFYVDLFSYHLAAGLTSGLGYAFGWEGVASSLKWVVGIGGVMSGGFRVGVSRR